MIAMCMTVALLISCIPIVSNAVSYSGSSSYMSGRYYRALSALTLTGDQRTDIVNVARSQIGYQEGSSSSKLSGEVAGKYNYTAYGRWYTSHKGTSYNHISSQWCAMFVSWCAYNAGVSSSIVPYAQYTEDQVAPFHRQGRSYRWSTVLAGGYTPQPGDIVFFLSDSSAASGRTVNHVGIVSGWDGNTLYTIEGNTTPVNFSTDGGCAADKSYSRSSTYPEYICSPAYINTDPIPQALRSVVFDHVYYYSAYADLYNALGTDKMTLYKHFKDNGITEGRAGSAILDIKYYLENNVDLAAAFDNTEDAFEHYIKSGFDEVRYTAPSADLGEIYATINYPNGDGDLVLDVDSDNNVIVSQRSDSDSQIWHIKPNGDTSYTVKNLASGLVLDVHAGSNDSGSNVQVYESNGSKAQKWFFHEYTTKGTYVIRSLCGATCVIDVHGASKNAGANVQMYTYDASAAQKFTVTAVASPEERDFNTESGFEVKENGGETLITGFTVGNDIASLSDALSDDCKIFDENGTEVKTGALCTGYVIKKYVNGLYANKAVVIVSGDITGDGKITAKDIIRAKKKSGGVPINGYVEAIDINGDGLVTPDDLSSMSGMIK